MNPRWLVPQISSSALARVLVLTALCGLVLWSHVYTGFDAVRIKVAREPRAFTASDLAVTMPETPRWQGLTPPVVLIARLQNPSQYPARIIASLGGERLALVLPSGGERRLDLVVPNGVSIHAGDVLTLHVDTDAAVSGGCCVLAYLEVANIHGASNTIPSFIIVPHGSRTYETPGWIVVLATTLTIGWLLARSSSERLTQRVRQAQMILAGATVLLFGASFASTLTSSAIVLSSKSFALGAIALTWPGIAGSWRDVRAALASRAAWMPRVLEATVVACFVALFYGLIAQTSLISHSGNYSGFLVLGREFADRAPFLTERPELKAQLQILDGAGYDGEFVYYIAFDPFLLRFKNEPSRYRAFVDAPPYRYGRIGFSLLTKLFSWDDPERYPRTMIWLIVAATFAGAWCLAALAQHLGYSGWWALLYVLVPGFIQSLRVGLPESIAAVGLLGGYLCILRTRYTKAALLFAASLLVRETGIVLVLILAIWTAWRARNRRGGMILAAAVVPFALWRAYIGWRLFSDLRWDAVFFNPQNLGIPFRGIVDLWRLIHANGYFTSVSDLAVAGTFYPLLLTVGLIASIYLVWKRPTALAVAAMAYALVAVSLNYTAIWVHVGNAERGTYEVILLLIMAFVTTERAMRHVRWLLGGFMACALLYVWMASVDATFVRYVVLSSLS